MFTIVRILKRRISYYWRVYRNYKLQNKKFLKSPIRFYNFWEINDVKEDWFYRFITHHELNKGKKRINFISLFGDKNIVWFIKRGIKIFFSGENMNIKESVFPNHIKFNDYYMDKVDLTMGFDYDRDNESNYFRFPLWIIDFVPPESTFESIKVLIDKYNSLETRKTLTRDLFAVHISRHDRNGIRTEIVEAMGEINNVCCAGLFMNNSNELQEKNGNNKLAFLKKFKFNICPENSDTDGYVTEKLFHAIISGCIPIYWGSKNRPEPEIINKEAVLFYSRDNTEGLKSKVRELLESDISYNNFLKIPPFQENAAEVIWDYLTRLRCKLDMIINKN